MPRSKAQKLAKKASRVRKREIALEKREQSQGISPPPDYWIRDPAFQRLAEEALAQISFGGPRAKKG
jgi:hypothetical protein